VENKTIYLIRHGKITQEDDQRRYIGQIDLPLSEEGVKQAQHLQRRFEHAGISAVYCSDLCRSVNTAKIVVGQRPVEIIVRQDLREVFMGEWEGCTFGDIATRFPNEFKARGNDIGYYRVPGGESFADCSQRAVAALEDIVRAPGGNVIIIGHAGLNRLILCHALGIPISNLFRISQDYGCLNILQSTSFGYQVNLMNGRGRLGRR
jgi:probable phosphoglycerate mutase